MKIKCQPEDFQVEELTAVTPGGGPFALYRMTKRSLGTPEAIDALAKRWRIRRDAFSFGGMNDRHALTSQHITIHKGPRQNQKQKNLEAEYLGQVAEPFMPHHIAANRFTITVRDLGASVAQSAETALDVVRANGLPNYFDEQRFGSVGISGEFVARAWCLGDFERALWLAIAEPNEHDRPEDKEQKKTLRDHWGQWDKLLAVVKGTSAQRCMERLLDQPTDFRCAIAALPSWQRDLYLSAFQSHLWNRMLDRLVRQSCDEASRFNVRIGPDDLAIFRTLTDESRMLIHDLELPFPSAREKPDSEPIRTLYHESLSELGLKAEQLKVKWPRDVFFKKGSRLATVTPGALSVETKTDELYPGRMKTTLHFDLPRGAYATILLKRAVG